MINLKYWLWYWFLNIIILEMKFIMKKNFYELIYKNLIIYYDIINVSIAVIENKFKIRWNIYIVEKIFVW